MKSVYIYSNGCSSNILDGERISRYFESNGYELTMEARSADIIVINTCAFEARSEKDSLEKIQELQELKPGRMIVCGCLPAINKEKLDEIYEGDYFIPRNGDSWSKLDQLIHADVPIAEIKEPTVLSHRWKDWKLIGVYKAFKENEECEAISGYDENVYHIRVATGCTGNCSFCAIRFARGHIRSRSLDEVIADFNEGLKKGYKSFKIWGDDVGDYGLDINTNLALLLSGILQIDAEFELEVLATNPKRFLELYDSLVPCLEDSRVKCLNISIQSGSPRILGLMNRQVDLDTLSSKIRVLKRRAPHLAIRAHYIVGFPHEGAVEFLSTMVFTFKARIFKYLVWKYDPKPRTPASQMARQVSNLRKEIYFRTLKSWGKLWSSLLEDGKVY